MPLTRSQNWPLKLRCYIEAQREARFIYGRSDCAVHATDWIRLATGADVYAEFRDRYDSAETASALIAEVTGKEGTFESAAEYIAAKYGLTEISPTLASRGDVVIFDSPEGQMFGIVHQNPLYSAFLAERGLLFLKTTTCKRAWRI